MKKMMTFLFLISSLQAKSQTLSGTFIFTRSVDFQRDITPDMKARMGNMPAKMDDEYELLFDNDKSLFRPSPVPEGMEGGGGGMMSRRMGPAETYCDFSSGSTVSVNEVGADVFVVNDSIEPKQWKLTNETKVILGYSCIKALTTREFKRRKMVVENGEQVRKEVTDTVPVEAWFTSQIPCPSGPEFQGTLPGMILEMNIGEGRMKYLAIDYRKKYEKRALVPPKGTVITRGELKAKQEEFWKSLRQGMGH